MHTDNAIDVLASSIYNALINERILPGIEYQARDWSKKEGEPVFETKIRRPRQSDIDITMFSQMWGSTALGFGGMGGAAMTEAYTVVITSQNNAAVFFDGRHAYTLKLTNEISNWFQECLSKRRMPSISDVTIHVKSITTT